MKADSARTPVKLVAAERGLERPDRGLSDGLLRWLSVPCAILLGWTALSAVYGSDVVPSPASTAVAFRDGIVDGWLITSIGSSLRVVGLAFVLATCAGGVVGLWLGRSPFWRAVLGGPLLWIYSLPKITVFPIFLLLFGLGEMSRLTFGAFHGFFPMAILVMSGVASIPNVYLRSSQVLGFSKWQRLVLVILPASLPSLTTGVRFCFSWCFLGVVLAEMFGSSQGAGYELVRLISLQRLPDLFALATALMLIALVLNVALSMVQRRAEIRGKR